jgi:tetratricopeptide (TPR) repeat protein
MASPGGCSRRSSRLEWTRQRPMAPCNDPQMFSRVRRRDQALTVLGIAGVIAGLALALLANLHIAGSIVAALGVLAVIAIATPKVVEPLAGLSERQRKEHDRLRAILVDGKLLQLTDVDPFKIGVFRSQAAEENSRIQGTPEYVKRKLDNALYVAFDEPRLALSKRLVVLRGDPKTGKSRTLWEALRKLPGRRLLALKAPDPGTKPPDPAAEPLSTLLALERPLSSAQGRDLVIWIDDAHNHLDHGLTRDNLRRLVELDHYSQAIIVATIHSARLDAIKDFDRELHALLREPFDELLLEPRLDDNELQAAREQYPGLADNPDLGRLPELFASVLPLIDRYQGSRATQPIGVAVAAAVIAWQRAGMPPDSIDHPTLKALTELTLREIAPARELTEMKFEVGLDWSMEPVAAFAALVRKNESDPTDTTARYRAFDAVVSWAQTNEPPLAPSVWDFVLKHADERSLNALATEANYAQQPAVAEQALITAMGSVDRRASAVAASSLGALMKEQARLDEAEAAFRSAIDSGHPDVAPMATLSLGELLKERKRFDEAEAAFRSAIDSGHPDVGPMATLSLGVLLKEQKRLDEAEATSGTAIDSGHPVVAGMVAVNLGLLLRERKRFDEAEAAFRSAIVDSSHPDVAYLAEQLLRALPAQDK